jgi:tRNA threonylcarbamoyl adenosine modification protein (Sua5/YciO/YrdC/YwlC family)
MIIEAQRYGLHPDDIDFIMAAMKKGRVGIVPTDSVYAFCCLANQKSAIETICRLKHIDPKAAMFSIVCKDLSQASEYFAQWETPVFRLLNKNLPGPFTFILNAGGQSPSFLKNKRKTIGLRIPNHSVIKSIMGRLTVPLMVSSVINSEEPDDYYTDTDQLIKDYEKQVGFIVIDEAGRQEASTVVDMTSGEPVIIRQSRHELKI